jgi:hypothetical protein
VPVTQDNTSKFAAKVRAAAAAGLRDYGKEQVRDLRGLIGTPWPPASRPGTPPHTRTGQLVEGIGAAVDEAHHFTDLSVYSSRAQRPKVPFWLEHGTKKMIERPYMLPTFHDVIARGLEPICLHIQGHLGGGEQ